MKSRFLFTVALMAAGVRLAAAPSAEPAPVLRQQALDGLKKAVRFYTEKISSHGGYAYYYGTDLKQAWGEGVATKDQIWTEPPGTPAVGLAFLHAYNATGDNEYLLAALNAGMALVYGQLQSGGWSQTIDFDPQGTRLNQYRNGRGTGLNHSSLDDDQTQSCIQFLARLDAKLNFKNAVIHEAVEYALDGLLKAQFPNGAFPQGWREPVEPHPVLKASYPAEWPRLWPHEEYHRYYTLNDGLAGTVSDTLLTAHEIYGGTRCLQALRKLGDFLILAQMPDPQPAWCQQYNFEMIPTWARKFEPPSICGLESEDAIKALMKIYRLTGDKKYLEPIPRAIAYLRTCVLPDGLMPRYRELKTNKPLYMRKPPGVGGSSNAPGYYEFTDDVSKAARHYGWKQRTEIEAIAAEFARLERAPATSPFRTPRLTPKGALESEETACPPAPGTKEFAALEKQVRQMLGALDKQGRWVDVASPERRLVGQPSFPNGFRYIGGDTFNWNVQTLGDYLLATREEGKQGECK